MNLMFFLHSKKAFSDVLEGVTSKNCLHTPRACLTPFFRFTSALTLLVMHFTISQVLSGRFH